MPVKRYRFVVCNTVGWLTTKKMCRNILFQQNMLLICGMEEDFFIFILCNFTACNVMNKSGRGQAGGAGIVLRGATFQCVLLECILKSRLWLTERSGSCDTVWQHHEINVMQYTSQHQWGHSPPSNTRGRHCNSKRVMAVFKGGQPPTEIIRKTMKLRSHTS